MQNANIELATCWNWTCLWKHSRIHTVAPYSTGTIAYDHTGGASERLVTLTSGTWPTWALYGNLLIGAVISSVESRISDTQITLEPSRNPGADVAAGTAYTIFQDEYPLPSDVRQIRRPMNESNSFWTMYMTPEEWAEMRRETYQSGETTAWTIIGDPNLLGSYALKVYPYPDAARTIDFTYQRMPRQLRFTGYEAGSYVGTVAGTSGTATLTGSSTAFKSSMIGSMIRLSPTGDTTVPTGLGGLSPWQEQKVITAVTSATDITVDSNLANSYSGSGYVVSDAIDYNQIMLPVFFRCCEKHLAILKNTKGVAQAIGLFEEALRTAKSADAAFFQRRSMYGPSGPGYDIFSGPAGADI